MIDWLFGFFDRRRLEVPPVSARVGREERFRRAAADAPCEPLRAPEDGPADWVRGSGAPPRQRLAEIVVLSDEEYEAWLIEHGDDAA